jgi:hypothetical protein
MNKLYNELQLIAIHNWHWDFTYTTQNEVHIELQLIGDTTQEIIVEGSYGRGFIILNSKISTSCLISLLY